MKRYILLLLSLSATVAIGAIASPSVFLKQLMCEDVTGISSDATQAASAEQVSGKDIEQVAWKSGEDVELSDFIYSDRDVLRYGISLTGDTDISYSLSAYDPAIKVKLVKIGDAEPVIDGSAEMIDPAFLSTVNLAGDDALAAGDYCFEVTSSSIAPPTPFQLTFTATPRNVSTPVQPVMAVAPAATPQPTLKNGEFACTGAFSNYCDGGYSSPFNWNYFSASEVSGWLPYEGTAIELWCPRDGAGQTFCELEADATSKGIKQPIANAVPGISLLKWKHMARQGIPATDSNYKAIFWIAAKGNLFNPTSSNAQKAFACPPSQWGDAEFAFEIPANFDPVTQCAWIAFVPDNNNTLGALIDSVTVASLTIVVDLENPKDTDKNGKIDDIAIDADRTGNVFGYSRAELKKYAESTCIIPIRAKVTLTPESEDARKLLDDKVTVALATITNGTSTSKLTWEHAVKDTPELGVLVYNAETKLWEAKATFTGLPEPKDGSYGRVPDGMHDLLPKKRVAVVTVNGKETKAEYEVYYGGSLKISGKVMPETTENLNGPLKELIAAGGDAGTEVLEKMNCSTEPFVFADQAKAKDNFAMRKAMIANMKSMNPNDEKSIAGYIGNGFILNGNALAMGARAGDTYYYTHCTKNKNGDLIPHGVEKFHAGFEWAPVSGHAGAFVSKTGVKPSVAISKIFPFRGECAGALEICLLKSAVSTIGANRFDEIHKETFLGIGYFLFVDSFKKHFCDVLDSNTIIPGDYIYMKNKDDYPDKLAPGVKGLWTGENCVYYGAGKFGGLGLENQTEGDLRNDLVAGYNRDCTARIPYTTPAEKEAAKQQVRFTDHFRIKTGE